MTQFHRLKEEAIVLFTDEANQGIFVEELNKSKSDFKYLFDLAILPSNLNWQKTCDDYELLKRSEKFAIWKRKSKYMRKFIEAHYKNIIT